MCHLIWFHKRRNGQGVSRALAEAADTYLLPASLIITETYTRLHSQVEDAKARIVREVKKEADCDRP